MPSPSCRGSTEPLGSKSPDLWMGEGSWKAWRPSSRLSRSSSSSREPFVVLHGISPSCLDLVSNEPKSLSLDSPAVGVNTVEAVWVWVLERAGKMTHSCDCSKSRCSGEEKVVAALSCRSRAAGGRMAGAQVGWQNAMTTQLSRFDGQSALFSILPLSKQTLAGPARRMRFSKAMLFCRLTIIKEARSRTSHC